MERKILKHVKNSMTAKSSLVEPLKTHIFMVKMYATETNFTIPVKQSVYINEPDLYSLICIVEFRAEEFQDFTKPY